MRILHVTRDLPPAQNGGLSAAVDGLVRAEQQAGHTCYVISFDGWRPARPRTQPPRRDGLVLRVAGDPGGAVAAFARDSAPEVVHVHDAALLPFVPDVGAPVVFTPHVLHHRVEGLRGVAEPTRSARAERHALENADVVLAPSAAVRDHILEYELCDEVRVARLGVHDSAEARAAVDVPREPVVLVSGRFADVKGTAEVVATIPQILDRAPAARIVIAGGVPENPKADRRWRRRFESLGSARVELTGWLGAAALSRRYHQARVLLVPSWFETFGLAALEAMLHGVAVVSTPCGGIESLVESGVTGVLTDRWLDATVALLEDADGAAEMGRAGAARARRDWLWPEVVADHLSAVNAVAA